MSKARSPVLTGIITCARPRQLRAALEAWASVRGQVIPDSPPLVVLDDEDPGVRGGNQEQAREVVSDWHASGQPHVGYVGRREKEAMAAILRAAPELAGARAGPAGPGGIHHGRDLTRFGLVGDEGFPHLAPRTNRNALILLGAGSTAVGLDEDLSWDVTAHGRIPSGAANFGAQPGEVPLGHLHLRSGMGLVGAAVFPSGAELSEAHPLAPWALDTALRAPLGRLSQVPGGQMGSLGSGNCSETANLEHASPLFTQRFRAGELRVAATMYPLCGHSGSSSTHYRLFLGGEDRARLVDGGEEVYRALRNSEWEYRGRPHPTLTDSGFFMHAASGYDLTQAVPPYLPHLSRGGDAVFAALLLLTSPGASVLLLPGGVHHEGPEIQRFGDDSIWKGGGDWNLSRLILMLLSKLAFPHGMPQEERGNAVVAPVRAAGAAGPNELEEQVRALYQDFLEQRLRALDAVYEEYGGYPRWWAEDVERAMDHIEGLLREGGQPLPGEFAPSNAQTGAFPATHGGAESAWLQLGRLLSRHADLLEVWPDLFQAARRLRPELWREVASPS